MLSFTSPLSIIHTRQPAFCAKQSCTRTRTTNHDNTHMPEDNHGPFFDTSPPTTQSAHMSDKPQPPAKKTPVHWRVPVFGIFIDQALGITNADLIRTHGPVFRTDLFGREFLMVSDRDAVEAIGRNSVQFRARGAWPATLDNALGSEHLGNIDGTYHRGRRAMINPIFLSHAILHLQPFVAQSAARTLEHAREVISEQGSVRLAPLVKNHLIDGVIRQSTGGNFSVAQLEQLKALFDRLSEGLFLPRWTPKGRRTYESRREILAMISDMLRGIAIERADVIERVRAAGDDAVGIRADVDLLTCILAASSIPTGSAGADEHSRQVEDELLDIAGIILHVWWASSDTSTSVTLSAIDNLWKHPSVYAALVREQESLSLSRNEEAKTLREYTQQTPLLASYIEENLRTRPPVAGTGRVANGDTSIMGHAVKAGDRIQLNLAAGNMDASVYEEPGVFKADRFLTTRDKKDQPPPVLSFGTGGSAHICIGNAMARANILTTLRVLIASYDVQFDPNQDAQWKELPIPFPNSGVQLIGLEPKNSNSR